MKKLILSLIIILFSFNNSVFATDACDEFLPVNQNFYGEVTIVARLRDYPCINKSSIIGSSKIGEKYKIVRKVDGWYEAEFENGTKAWIWDQAITKLYDYTVVNNNITEEKKEEEKIGYSLDYKDIILINKIVNKVKIKVEKEGISYKYTFIKKLEDVKTKYELTPRLQAIFSELIKKVNEIGEVKKEEINYNNSKLGNYKIDFEQVKNTWLSRNNSERKSLGKYEYKYNEKLEQTAFEWSETMKSKNEITHKRNSNDSYYNYYIIAKRFSDRGIVCKNDNKVTFSENIGQGIFTCKDDDCTEELINGIKSSFDFYMSEKTKSSQPHYLSLVNDYFKEIGLGIALSKTSDTKYKYYLTVHYCTQIK